MGGQSTYVPPAYIPLGQSDIEAEVVAPNDEIPVSAHPGISSAPAQWSSGICACCDDLQSWEASPSTSLLWYQVHLPRACGGPTSLRKFEQTRTCCIGLVCPCFLFGKNAEFLGSGTLIGSCMTHFILWALVNTVCCLLTDGILLGLPGCFVACYSCGYRKALRAKYNLQEAPCGDFVTHFFCHLCAVCQEYREIQERSDDSGSPDLSLVAVKAPSVQTMELASTK
ncbi:unnamed protein product [Camellia sinensis]